MLDLVGTKIVGFLMHRLKYEMVQIGNDQEKVQSEINSHSKNPGGEKLN